ncbi:MAG: hypothetical protein JWQ71_4713 [Pedosphaera sp.]|nr:hypothetical protein [Pedosphaera sp.]
MKISKWFFLLVIGIALAQPVVAAEPIQTLDLKPFVGPSPFQSIGADWLLPRGKQVFDGIPFQIDGAILLYGTNVAQKTRPGRTNVNNIPVGRRFDKLHLLAAAHSSSTEGITIAKIHLLYVDGSDTTLDIRYGDHVRNWFASWHKADRPLKDPNVHEAWHSQNSAASTTDDYLRLIHVPLTNASPEKEVRAISLESTKRSAGLMIVAMSVGPASAEPLPNTLFASTNLFPDLRPRQGEPVRGAGVVKTREGEPLAGVHLIVSGVREFSQSYSDSNSQEPAVGLEATTDADGKFTMPPLPDNRMYRLLAIADKFESFVYGGFDPKSDPIEIRLIPATNAPVQGKYAVHARVIGPEGKPVPWAFVKPEGVGTDSGTSWGGTQNFPEQVITSTNGEFILSRSNRFTRLQVNITAPNLAPAKLWLPETNILQTVELGVGATVRGRVLKDGKPLFGVKVGISGADRNSEVYIGHYETKTDTNGIFTFQHLPPQKQWWLYGIMASFKSHGALPPQRIDSAGHGESTDLGDLPVSPGLHLAGRVETRHGEPIPKSLKVRASNNNAWDSQAVSVDAEGHFKLDGLAKGQLEISADQSGWRLAIKNRSLDVWNPWYLSGLLEKDKDDLLLVIEKGERNYNSGSSNGQLPPQDQPQGRPLSGAEPSGPPPIVLAGRILDDATGQPIPLVHITPGRQPPISTAPAAPKPLIQQVLGSPKKTVPWNERPFWQLSHKESVTNGNFFLEFIPLTSQPILRVEAIGYQPLDTEPIGLTTSNLVFRLKRGAGPNGIVLLPDGKPAEGATILYAAAEEQFSLNGRTINVYSEIDRKSVTGKDGKFLFSARPRGVTLFATHPTGYAEESVEKGGDNLKLRLKPWAVIIGTLVNSNGVPLPNVQLGLTLQHDWQNGGALMHHEGRTITDAQGHFQFLDVPPRRLEVQRIIPSSPNGWSESLQTWLVATSGTNDLGKITYDQPPPPPALERLKQKLGL